MVGGFRPIPDGIMRIALVLLIAVTQTAGPWLCCCGAERLASWLAARPTAG